MLYIGELVERLNNQPDAAERANLLKKYHSSSFVEFLRLYIVKPEWKKCLTNLQPFWYDAPHGWTISNLHREVKRLRMFYVGGGYDHIPDEKIVDIYEKMLMQMHQSESKMVNDIVNGTYKFTYLSNEEITQYLGAYGVKV